MTGWQEIKKSYARYFKSELSTWQLSLFYFGQPRGAHKRPESASKTIQLKSHRNMIEREVAPWDVVIRLAFLYIYQQVKSKKLKFNDGFSYDKLNRMIYATLWSEFRRTNAVVFKGETKYMPTFWSFAINNKNKFQTVVAPSGLRRMDKFIGDALTKMMKNRGMKN